MHVQIGKWGNSLAVRLPAAFMQRTTLKEGDVLEATIEPNGELRLSPMHNFDKQAFLLKLDKLHRSLPQTESVIDLLKQEERY